MSHPGERDGRDLYSRLSEATPVGESAAEHGLGTYETKTIESVDEEFAGSLLGAISL